MTIICFAVYGALLSLAFAKPNKYINISEFDLLCGTWCYNRPSEAYNWFGKDSLAQYVGTSHYFPCQGVITHFIDAQLDGYEQHTGWSFCPLGSGHTLSAAWCFVVSNSYYFCSALKYNSQMINTSAEYKSNWSTIIVKNDKYSWPPAQATVADHIVAKIVDAGVTTRNRLIYWSMELDSNAEIYAKPRQPKWKRTPAKDRAIDSISMKNDIRTSGMWVSTKTSDNNISMALNLCLIERSSSLTKEALLCVSYVTLGIVQCDNFSNNYVCKCPEIALISTK